MIAEPSCSNTTMSRHSMLKWITLPFVALLIGALSLGFELPAQGVVQRRASSSTSIVALAPVEGVAASEFSRVASVRELSDGRVLVADSKDNSLSVVDFKSGTVQSIGTKGRGPGEFETVGKLWPMRGDSTLMAVPMSGRWLILAGSRIAVTVPASSGLLRAAGSPMSLVHGVTNENKIFSQTFAVRANQSFNPLDSMLLLRIDRRTLSVDTLAMLGSVMSGAAPGVAPIQERGGGAAKSRTVMSLAARDQVTSFPDGTVAIVRAKPYRVDWCTPVSNCVAGNVLQASEPRMSDEWKRVILTWQALLMPVLMPTDISQTTGWPATVPPFVVGGGLDDGASFAAPDGSVLVERVPTPQDRLATYDIVDRMRGRTAVLRMPLNQRVVGFGPNSVYTVEIDGDGLQRLRRHHWGR